MKNTAFILLIIALAGCDSGGEDLITRTFAISPTATFLRADNVDTPSAPAMIDLAAEGIAVGAELRLRTRGSYFNDPLQGERRSAAGVFSGSATLLASSELNRVADAIDAGQNYVTENTFEGGQTTDIPEDFRFDEDEITVTVPQGAVYLFVGNIDSKQSDNSATPDGFRVQLSWE